MKFKQIIALIILATTLIVILFLIRDPPDEDPGDMEEQTVDYSYHVYVDKSKSFSIFLENAETVQNLLGNINDFSDGNLFYNFICNDVEEANSHSIAAPAKKPDVNSNIAIMLDTIINRHFKAFKEDDTSKTIPISFFISDLQVSVDDKEYIQTKKSFNSIFKSCRDNGLCISVYGLKTRFKGELNEQFWFSDNNYISETKLKDEVGPFYLICIGDNERLKLFHKQFISKKDFAGQKNFNFQISNGIISDTTLKAFPLSNNCINTKDTGVFKATKEFSKSNPGIIGVGLQTNHFYFDSMDIQQISDLVKIQNNFRLNHTIYSSRDLQEFLKSSSVQDSVLNALFSKINKKSLSIELELHSYDYFMFIECQTIPKGPIQIIFENFIPESDIKKLDPGDELGSDYKQWHEGEAIKTQGLNKTMDALIEAYKDYGFHYSINIESKNNK
jgi:hypothetical protein